MDRQGLRSAPVPAIRHRTRPVAILDCGDAEAGVEFAQIEDAIDKVIADLAQNTARAEDSNGQDPAHRNDLAQDNQRRWRAVWRALTTG